jgi:hypothetical protein
MKRAGWLLIFLGLAGSIITLYQRAGWESKTYTLAYDYSEALSLAAMSGNSIGQVLGALKKAGVNSVAISQYKAGDAYRQGKLQVFDGNLCLTTGTVPPQLEGKIKPGSLYILPQDRAVAKDLAALLPDLGGKRLDGDLWELTWSLTSFLDQPLGLPTEKLELAKAHGLAIIVRLENDQRFGPDATRYLLAQGKGSQALLCKGREVLGYPGRISFVAQELDRLRLPYALIEFSKQSGQESLASLAAPGILRLHTIPRPELDKMSAEKAQDRFVRAATERSIPLLYLRPLLTEEGDLLEANVSFVRSLKSRLKALGYSPQLVEPRSPWHNSLPLFYLVALAPLGACLCLSERLQLPFAKIFLATLAVIWLALPLLALLRARQLFALFAAIVFPLFAIIAASDSKGGGTYRAGLAGLLALLGGLVVSSLLGSWQFALALWRFAGVKLAFLFPLALVGLWAFSPLRGEGGWEKFKKWLAGQLEAPVRVWHVLLGLFVALMLAIYLLRSGNTGLAPQWERALRATLERVFRYRPRTKEFLGYPLLVLAFSLAPSLWQRLFVTLGTVALVSTINSFAHAHSPLLASLVRSFWGLALGLVLGWVLTLVVRKLQAVISRG